MHLPYYVHLSPSRFSLPELSLSLSSFSFFVSSAVCLPHFLYSHLLSSIPPPFFECKLWLLQRYSAAIHRRSLLFQLFSMKMQSPPLGCIKQDGNWYCLFFTSAHIVLFPLYCLSRKTWSRVSYWFLYRAVWSLEFCAYDKLLSCQLLKVHLVRQLIVESHFHLAKYWPTQWSAVLQTFKIL